LTYLGFAKEFAAIANPLPNDNITILAERGLMLRMAETSPLYQIMPNGGNYYLHKFIFHLLLKSGSLLLFCTIIHMTKCPNSSVPSKQQIKWHWQNKIHISFFVSVIVYRVIIN
jgi:hypothetical protein